MPGQGEVPLSESEHRWLWGLLVYVDEAEAHRIASGERKTFRKLDPYDRSRVQGAAVFCERCQRPFMETRNEPCFQAPRRDSRIVLPPGV